MTREPAPAVPALATWLLFTMMRIYDTMVRLQIQLPESQHRALRRWADRLGISLAEAIRRCVADRLTRDAEASAGRAERVREAQAVVGKYASGRSDVGERHDDYLSDAFGA